MKNIYMIACASLISASAFGSSQMACWNLYSKAGSKPVLTATLLNNNAIANIKITQDPAGDIFDQTGVSESAVGAIITSSRSPYKGNQAFILANGIRLILPADLSSPNLNTSTIPGGSLPSQLAERQNAVFDIVGSRYNGDQVGDGYVRMHCVAH